MAGVPGQHLSHARAPNADDKMAITIMDDALERIGFDIGWDYARFGRKVEHRVQIPSVTRGFYAGSHHFKVPQHCADRFVAKWLQLRLSAFRRGRVVAGTVTPDYLRIIDSDHCPVTLGLLTHSTLMDTDWSVDRINNDGCYAAGNLMVISVRANRAKGRKSFSDVKMLSSGDATEAIEGLSRREWARLACLMHGADEIALQQVPCGPLLTQIPLGCRVPLYYLLQQVMLESARPASRRNAFLKAVEELQLGAAHDFKLRLALERLALLQKRVDYPYDALGDQGLQGLVLSWYRVAASRQMAALCRIAQTAGALECPNALPADWATAAKGFFTTGVAAL